MQALPGVEAGFQKGLAVGDTRGEYSAGDGFVECGHGVGEGNDGLFAGDVYGTVTEERIAVGGEGGDGRIAQVGRKYRITVLN